MQTEFLSYSRTKFLPKFYPVLIILMPITLVRGFYSSTDSISEHEKKNYSRDNLQSMSEDYEDLMAFLEGFGFPQDEQRFVLDELNAFRSIAGTTLKRYMNRVIETIDEEERHAFLKGIMVGIVIRKAVDALEEPDLTEEEKRIDREIDNLKMSRK